MKTFLKYDFYCQFFFLIVGILAAIFEGIPFFYFIVGISQLISFLIRIFQKSRKSVLYIFYGVLILPVWLALLFIICFEKNDITSYAWFVLILSFVYSPILAAFYLYECYENYESSKNIESLKTKK
jgi:cobalamin biosynthesis protein CobD/CbiB